MTSHFSRTIVALGGGGFSFTGDLTPLDHHVLDLARRRRLAPTGQNRDSDELPRVCFVPTASGDSRDYIGRFERAFADVARTSVCSLFTHDGPTWFCDPQLLLEQDVIYVGGGSTAKLLAVWRLHGLPEILRTAAANGTVLAGISAGANCWFESSSTDSFGPLAPLDDGLGFLPGSICPHLFGEPGRYESYRQWIADGTLPDGYGVDDYVALVSWDDDAPHAVSERPGHRAVRIERTGARTREVAMPTFLLESAAPQVISAIRDLLGEVDLMGLLEMGAPADEYGPEAQALAVDLPRCTSAGDVADHLHRAFAILFDGCHVPEREQFTDVARAIWADDDVRRFITQHAAPWPTRHLGR